MGSLTELQKNWEELAQTDPMWAICADPEKRNRRWTREEFFATGVREIEKVLGHLRSLGVQLDSDAPVLDFGCGVGRLTRALSSHFHRCWGVDISATMIANAREFNGDCANCTFWLNETDNLKRFSDGYFGFIYTSIVLQHIEPRFVKAYLGEFVRVLKPGGVLVFQITDRFKAGIFEELRMTVALRRRLLTLFGKKKADIMMHHMTETDVRRVMAQFNVKVIDVRLTNSAESAFNGDLRYLDHEPEHGYVSKQYSVVKPHL